MSNPTREQIHDAYEALETLTNTCIHSGDLAEELQELVLRALPPKPRPTMAEIEWDDEVHYLAEATHLVYKTVLMLGQDSDDAIKFLALNRADSKTVWGQPRDLTPTGKRYTLTEVQE